MTEIAYTIGRITAYDIAVKDPNGQKLGQRLNAKPPYEGGWVWRSWKSAENFRTNMMSQEVPEWMPKDFSVYELELPVNWDHDVCKRPIIQTCIEGCAHYLLHDAKIIRRVEFDPEDPTQINLEKQNE